MIGEIGELSLSLALALSLVMAMTGFARENATLSREIASGAAIGFFVFAMLACASLTYAALTSDFSIQSVAQNSNLAEAPFGKLAGVWENNWMLLLALLLAIISGAMAFAKRGALALGALGLLASALLLFILFAANPFLRLDPPPFDGAGPALSAPK